MCTTPYEFVQLCPLEYDLKLLPAAITDWHVLERVLTGGRIAEPDNLAICGGRAGFPSSPSLHACLLRTVAHVHIPDGGVDVKVIVVTAAVAPHEVDM